jgi:hypothetical protein
MNKKENKTVKEKPTEFFSSTIGMMARHPNMYSSKLVRVNFYRTNLDRVALIAISGNNLERIRGIPFAYITIDEYNNRPQDPYDDSKEFFWALEKLGFEFNENNYNEE